MAFADDIVFIFAGAGLGTPGVDLLIGPRGVIPDSGALSVIPSGGPGPVGTHNSTDVPAYVRPTAQIVSRAPTYVASEAKSQQAWNVLFPVRNRLVNGTWYLHILMLQDPFPLGEDENNLVRFVFNVGCEKRPSPATS
jgi:hypothetical protein